MQALAKETPEIQRRIVDKVKKGQGLSVFHAQRIITKDEALNNIRILPDGKYTVIYADPPWNYNDKQGGTISKRYGAAEKHYPSMNLISLKSMDIQRLSAKNAVLFLWATSPLLPDALELCRAWDFQYKSAFIWDKIKHNMGHYNSVRHEMLLIATKGKCTPQIPKLFNSVQTIERTAKHSEKPEKFREIIDTLYPEGNRIELFRRGKPVKNWVVWGNEIAA